MSKNISDALVSVVKSRGRIVRRNNDYAVVLEGLEKHKLMLKLVIKELEKFKTKLYKFRLKPEDRADAYSKVGMANIFYPKGLLKKILEDGGIVFVGKDMNKETDTVLDLYLNN